MKKLITIGKGKTAAKSVQIGVPSPRKIADPRLIIGESAVLRSGTVIYLGSRIGSHLQTGHNALIREQNVIGDHFSIWSNSVVDYDCRIGDHVKVHCNCYIAQFSTLEDEVFLAPGVVVANDLHPGTEDAFDCMKGATIKRRAQIGCNVTILPRVVIGEGTLVGAGSVVTRDLPSGVVAYGNPARPVKRITDYKCPVKGDFPYADFLKGLP